MTSDDIYGVFLVVLSVTTVVMVVVLERRRRRAEANSSASKWDPERARAQIREHGGPYGGVTDGDAPTWSSPDEFALSLAIVELSELGFFADSADTPLRERVAQLGQAYEAQYHRPFRHADPFREPELAALDRSRVWWRDAEADVGSGNNAYAELLREWSDISRGRLVVRDVRESWQGERGPVELAIDMEEGTQTLQLSFLEDWLDLDGLLRVNALVDGLEFMPVHTGDQTAYIVCATVDEAVRLQDRGWPILGRRREPSSSSS